MLRGLFSKARAKAGVMPAGGRAYVMGDVHGRLDLLQDLWGQICADMASAPATVHVVGLGDTIDRGPDSAGVLGFLQDLPPAPRAYVPVWLRGNHEQAMLDFLDSGGTQAAWLDWGGIAALQSYGIAVRTPDGRARGAPALCAELTEVLAGRGDVDFLRRTKLYFTLGSWLMVHAGVRRGLAPRDQLAHDLLMIRDEFLGQPHMLPYRVIYGHTPTPAPKVEDDKVGIDTGAYRTGVLTCAVLEGDGMRFLQTQGAAA